MRKKILIVIGLICMYICLNCSNIYANDSLEDESKYTEAYKEYLKLSDEEKSKISAIPRKYVVTYDEYIEQEKLYNNEERSFVKAPSSLPSKFFLGDKINLTVDNQGAASWCWAFTSLNCAETNYQLTTGKDLNLAEYHLAYKRAGSLGGWRNYITVSNAYNFGGNFYDFERYVFNGYGPVLGTDLENKKYKDEEEILAKFNSTSPIIKVAKTINFPTITKMYDNKGKIIGYNVSDDELLKIRNKIKEHIMNNGSLYASTDSSTYKNQVSIYNPWDNQDHAISIVGWDDNYSKTNFKIQPKHDGAYIIQNSWGTSRGNNGYYYVSYDDAIIEKEISGVVSTYEINHAVKTNVEVLGYSQEKDAVAVLLHSNQLLKDMDKLGFEVYEQKNDELAITYVKYYTKNTSENFYVSPKVGNSNSKTNVKFSVNVNDYPKQMTSVKIKTGGEKITINSLDEVQLECECSPSTANYTYVEWRYYQNSKVITLYKNGTLIPYNNGIEYIYACATDGSGVQDEKLVEVNVDHEAQNDDFKYNVNLRNGVCYVTISKYIGTDKDVVIPAYIDGMKVVKIGDNAFANNKEIESVVSYSSNLYEIGNNAFSGCTNLKIFYTEDLYGKDSIHTIGDNAFLNCFKLLTINTRLLDKIGKSAFKNCDRLKYFYIRNNMTSVESDAFTGWDKTHYISFYSDKDNIYMNLDFLNNCKANVTYGVSTCDSLTLSDTSLKFVSESSKKITYDAFPTESLGIDFVSTNNLVATVDKNGNITPKKDGKCKIIALSKDGSARAVCNVEVEIVDSVKGDFNGNSKVDVTDAYLLLTSISKNSDELELKKAVADMNDDGKIDVTDAYLLLKQISKI